MVYTYLPALQHCHNHNPVFCFFFTSFAVNPLNPGRQETICLLQNGTQAANPAAKPLRALNQYYMVKMSIRSGKRMQQPKHLICAKVLCVCILQQIFFIIVLLIQH